MPPYSTIQSGGGGGAVYTAGNNITISTDNVIASVKEEQEEFFYITGMFKDMASLSGTGSYDFMEWTSNSGANVIPSITCTDNWTLVKASFCWTGASPIRLDSGESYTIKIATINTSQASSIANVTYKTPTLFTLTSNDDNTQASLVSGDLNISFSQADRICVIGEELGGVVTPNTQDGQLVLKFKLTDTPSTQSLNTFTGGSGINISNSNVISVGFQANADINTITSTSEFTIRPNGGANNTIDISNDTISCYDLTNAYIPLKIATLEVVDLQATSNTTLNNLNVSNVAFFDGTQMTTATPTWIPTTNPNYLTQAYQKQVGVEYIANPGGSITFVVRDIYFQVPFTDLSNVVIHQNVMYNNIGIGGLSYDSKILGFTVNYFRVMVNNFYTPGAPLINEPTLQVHWEAWQVPQRTITNPNTNSWAYSIQNET